MPAGGRESGEPGGAAARRVAAGQAVPNRIERMVSEAGTALIAGDYGSAELLLDDIERRLEESASDS